MSFREYLKESYNFTSGIKSIKSKYKSLDKFNIIFDEDSMIAELKLIKISKDEQGTGVGSKVMQDLIDLADEHDVTLTLSPTNEFGMDIKKLTDFYKKFGFVENKGKNKYYDANGTYVRTPKF